MGRLRMLKYRCPKCEAELSWDHDQGPYYVYEGEALFCSSCKYKAHISIFKRATYVIEEKERKELRSQVERDKPNDDSLVRGWLGN